MVLVSVISLIALWLEPEPKFLGIRAASGKEQLVTIERRIGQEPVVVVIDEYQSEKLRPTWFDISATGEFVSVILAGKNVRILAADGKQIGRIDASFGTGNIIMPTWLPNGRYRFGNVKLGVQDDAADNLKIDVFEMSPPDFSPKLIGGANGYLELTRKYFGRPNNFAKLALPAAEFTRLQFDAELAGIGPWSDPVHIDREARLTLFPRQTVVAGEKIFNLVAFAWNSKKETIIRTSDNVPRFMRLARNGLVSYTSIKDERSFSNHGISGPRVGYTDAFSEGPLREHPISVVADVLSGQINPLVGIVSAIPIPPGK